MEIYPATMVVGRFANSSFGILNLPIALAENIFSHGTFGDIRGHLPTFGQFL
jgi:hypothetical protein